MADHNNSHTSTTFNYNGCAQPNGDYDFTQARFIETQNRMNRYAKFEHFPTDDVFRDMLSAFEETMRGQIDEALVNITESDIAEFQSLFDILTVEEFFDLFRIIGFMYNINYDRNYRVWELELIGRSTTLFVEWTSNSTVARNYGHRRFNDIIPSIRDWMDLNNVPSLDIILRLHLNLEFGIVEAELVSIPLR